MAESISTLLIGAIGGFLATLSSNFIWRWITKPKLELGRIIWREYVHSPNETANGLRYKASIKNKGRNAATNCKASLFLLGEGNGKIYVVDSNPAWDEQNSPSRITINRGETADFEILEVNKEDDRKLVKFPSVHGWKSPSSIELWDAEFIDGKNPHEKYTLDKKDAQIKLTEYLTWDQLQEIEWSTISIEITSENTQKEKAYLNIVFNEDQLYIYSPSTMIKAIEKIYNRF